jgi:hypothetical protein
MTAAELLHDLQSRHIQLWVEGERLHYDAPTGAMTEELLSLVRAHKGELLRLCSGQASRTDPASSPTPRSRPETARPKRETAADNAQLLAEATADVDAYTLLAETVIEDLREPVEMYSALLQD